MTRFSSIFSQLLQLFPRLEFEQAVKQHQAERSTKGFSSWGQFVAMLFCQLGRAHSLREICGGLASCEGKLKHLGILEAPKKSTLAYANEHRPWELYRTVFEQTLGKCQSVVAAAGCKKKFRFKNKLISLDSSTIDLCMSVFDWAKFRRTKGAVKLHLLLDHDGHLPSYAVITDGKKSDIHVARGMKFASGTVLVMDRGYNDYDWFAELTDQEVFFVTRMKDNAVYDVVERRDVPNNGHVRSDFFKALKQSCKIKTFLGTSANAVHTQIWTALIAMLVLKYLQLKSTFGWSLSNLLALLRLQLFVYRDLHTWLNAPFEAPPSLEGIHDVQLVLNLAG